MSTSFADNQPTYMPPRMKRIILVLDGSTGQSGLFNLLLQEPLRESVTIGLSRYVVTNTPTTSGAIPDTPILDLHFNFANGAMNLTPCSSNTLASDSFILMLSGENTTQAFQPSLPLGDVRSGHVQQLIISVRDIAGAPHDPSTHKLFDWCVLELMAVETVMKRSPPYLLKVPSIQQTFDTI